MDNEWYVKVGRKFGISPLFVYGPLVMIFIVLGLIKGKLSFTLILGLFISGIVWWTLLEYIVHRFILHYKTDKEPIKFLTSGFHAMHHELPYKKDYIFTPIILTFPVYIIKFGFFWLITGNLFYALILEAGLGFAYMTYELTHYLIHHSKSQNRALRKLRTNHFTHHFKDSKKFHGITTPLWDFVFKTL